MLPRFPIIGCEDHSAWLVQTAVQKEGFARNSGIVALSKINNVSVNAQKALAIGYEDITRWKAI